MKRRRVELKLLGRQRLEQIRSGLDKGSLTEGQRSSALAELIDHKNDFAFLAGPVKELPGPVRFLRVVEVRLDDESTALIYIAVSDNGVLRVGPVSAEGLISDGEQAGQPPDRVRHFDDFDKYADRIVTVAASTAYRPTGTVADVWIVIERGQPGSDGAGWALYHALIDAERRGEQVVARVRAVHDSAGPHDEDPRRFQAHRLDALPDWARLGTLTLAPDVERAPFQPYDPSLLVWPSGTGVSAAAPGLVVMGVPGGLEVTVSGRLPIFIHTRTRVRTVALDRRAQSGQRVLLVGSDAALLGFVEQTWSAETPPKLRVTRDQRVPNVVTAMAWVDDGHLLLADSTRMLYVVHLDRQSPVKALIERLVPWPADSSPEQVLAQSAATTAKLPRREARAVRRALAEWADRLARQGTHLPDACKGRWRSIWQVGAVDAAFTLEPLLSRAIVGNEDVAIAAAKTIASWLRPIYLPGRFAIQMPIDHFVRTWPPMDVDAQSAAAELLVRCRQTRIAFWRRHLQGKASDRTATEHIRRAGHALERLANPFIRATSIDVDFGLLVRGCMVVSPAAPSSSGPLLVIVGREHRLRVWQLDRSGKVEPLTDGALIPKSQASNRTSRPSRIHALRLQHGQDWLLVVATADQVSRQILSYYKGRLALSAVEHPVLTGKTIVALDTAILPAGQCIMYATAHFPRSRITCEVNGSSHRFDLPIPDVQLLSVRGGDHLTLLVAATSGPVHCCRWEYGERQAKVLFRLGIERDPTAVHWTDEGSILVGGRQGLIACFELASQDEPRLRWTNSLDGSIVRAVDYRSMTGAQRVAALSQDGELCLFDLDSGDRICSYTVPIGSSDLAVGSDGSTTHLVVVAPDRLISFIEADPEQAFDELIDALRLLKGARRRDSVLPLVLEASPLVAAALQRPFGVAASLAGAIPRLKARADRCRLLRLAATELSFGAEQKPHWATLARVLDEHEIERLMSYLTMVRPQAPLPRLLCDAMLDAVLSANDRHEMSPPDVANALAVLMRSYARLDNVEVLIKIVQRLRTHIARSKWLALEAARLLTAMTGADPAVAPQRLLDRMTDLPTLVVEQLRYLRGHFEDDSEGLAPLERILRALLSGNEPRDKDLEALGKATSTGFTALLAALSQLELATRESRRSTRRRTSGSPDAQQVQTSSQSKARLRMLESIDEVRRALEIHTRGSYRRLTDPLQHALPPQSARPADTEPLADRMRWITDSLQRVATVRSALGPATPPVDISPKLWRDPNWEVILHRLARRAVQNLHHLLESEWRLTAGLTRARVEREQAGWDADGHLNLELRLSGEGELTLQHPIIRVTAKGKDGLTGPGRLEFEYKPARWPGESSKNPIQLHLDGRPARESARSIVVRVTVDPDAKATDGVHQPRTEEWPIKLPPRPKHSSKLPHPHGVPLHFGWVSQRAVHERSAGLMLVVYPNDWSPGPIVDAWRMKVSPLVDLDRLMDGWGRGLKYERRGLSAGTLWQRTHAVLETAGSVSGAALGFGQRFFHRAYLRERRGLLGAWADQLADYAISSSRPVTVLAPVDVLPALLERTLVPVVPLHRLPGERDGFDAVLAPLETERSAWVAKRLERPGRAIAATGGHLGWLDTMEAPPRSWESFRSLLTAELRGLPPAALAWVILGAGETSLGPEHLGAVDVGHHLVEPVVSGSKTLLPGGRVTQRDLNRFTNALNDRNNPVNRASLRLQGCDYRRNPYSKRSELARLCETMSGSESLRARAVLVEMGYCDDRHGLLRTRSPWRTLIREEAAKINRTERDLHLLHRWLEPIGGLAAMVRRQHFVDLSNPILDVLAPHITARSEILLLRKTPVLWEPMPPSDSAEREAEIISFRPGLSLASAFSDQRLRLFEDCVDGEESEEGFSLELLIMYAEAGTDEALLASRRRDYMAHRSLERARIYVVGPAALQLPDDREHRWAVLRWSDVLAALGSASSLAEAMDDVGRAQLPLMHLSPFKTGGALPPGSPLFVGRLQERQWIDLQVRRHSILIVGERQMGKTSLLNQIHHELQDSHTGHTPISWTATLACSRPLWRTRPRTPRATRSCWPSAAASSCRSRRRTRRRRPVLLLWSGSAGHAPTRP